MAGMCCCTLGVGWSWGQRFGRSRGGENRAACRMAAGALGAAVLVALRAKCGESRANESVCVSVHVRASCGGTWTWKRARCDTRFAVGIGVHALRASRRDRTGRVSVCSLSLSELVL